MSQEVQFIMGKTQDNKSAKPTYESTYQRFKQKVQKSNNGDMDKRWEDSCLLRFLKARKFNLKDTEKTSIDFIKSRKDMETDTLSTYYFPQLTVLRKQYTHGYHKIDKFYRPIYIQMLGFTHYHQIFNDTTKEALLKYYAMSYETLLSKFFEACTQQKKRETADVTKILQNCSIIDLKGIHLTHANVAQHFIKPVAEMAQHNSPQILGKWALIQFSIYIINALFLFKGVWAVFKMQIDQKIKQKIKIFRQYYTQELLQVISAENLPVFIDGGTCRCKGGDCLALNIGLGIPKDMNFFPAAWKDAASLIGE